MKPTLAQLIQLKELAEKAVVVTHTQPKEAYTRTTYTNDEYPGFAISVSNLSTEDTIHKIYHIYFILTVTTEYGIFTPRIHFRYFPVLSRGRQGVYLVSELSNKDGTVGYNLTKLLPIFTTILEDI